MIKQTRAQVGWVILIVVLVVIVIGAIIYYTASPSNNNYNNSSNQSYTIAISSVPSNVLANQSYRFAWTITGPAANVSETGIYYSRSSVSTPDFSYYDFNSPLLCTNSTCNIPGSFSTNISGLSNGTYYYRIYADINGKDVWSPEQQIMVGLGNSSLNGTQGNQTGNQTGNNVTINDYFFSPMNLTISVGDRVMWFNNGSATHTVTSDSGNELDSRNLDPGENYSHVFSMAGNYSYHCSIHQSMKGNIRVINNSSSSYTNLYGSNSGNDGGSSSDGGSSY